MSKNTFLSIIILLIISILSSCEKIGGGGDYTVNVGYETQVYKFKGEDINGRSNFSWVTTGSNEYTEKCDANDEIKVEFPAIIKITDNNDGTFTCTFNEEGTVCNIKNMTVSNSKGSGMVWTEYVNNNCGRTKIGFKIEEN